DRPPHRGRRLRIRRARSGTSPTDDDRGHVHGPVHPGESHGLATSHKTGGTRQGLHFTPFRGKTPQPPISETVAPIATRKRERTTAYHQAPLTCTYQASTRPYSTVAATGRRVASNMQSVQQASPNE